MSDTVVVTSPDAALAVLQPTLSDAIAVAQLYASQANAAEIGAVAAETICNNAETVALAAASSAQLSAAAAQAAAAGVGFGSTIANKLWASPDGSSGFPTFRSIANGDLPAVLAPASISVTSNATIGGTLGVTGASTLGAISASGVVSGAGFSTYLASPPGIGLTTPAAAQFTNLTSATGKIVTSPSLTVAPIGNTLSTLSSKNIQASSASSTVREFLTTIGFAANTGSVGGHTNIDDKVALYVGGTCSSGAKAAWAENILMTLNTPLNANFFAALSSEIDFNNFSGNNFHNTYAAVGNLTQYVGNLLLAGAGPNQADFALAVGGVNSSTGLGMYNRGILFLASLGAVQADIWSESAAVSFLADFGSHTYGLDLKAAAYSGAGIIIRPVGSSGTGLAASGTYTVATMADSSTAPYGLALSGTYATAALFVSGLVQLTASTISKASMNIPQGAAPTSPVNGDIWMTSAGLFYRFAGTTHGPL